MKKIKWASQIVIVLLLLSIVGSRQVIEKVFAEDSVGIQNITNEEPVARTGGAQRIDVNNLVWTPVSATNPLGGADDFSAFLFDSFVDFHETGGPVAAGRFENINIVTFEEGLYGGINQFYDYTIPKFNVGLIAENGISGLTTKVHNGDTAVHDEKYFDMTENIAGNDFVRQAQIRQFMSQAKYDLVSLNHQVWNLPTNGTIGTDNWNRTVLTADKEMNVFEINLTTNTDLDISDTYPGSTIVIKLKGNQIKLKSMSVNGVMINYENINQIANRVLWVFDPSEPLVTFQQSNVTGSVLAPKTNIRFTGGYSSINGTLIANSLNGEKSSSELHYIGHYIGKLTKDPVIPENPDTSDSTPEPSDSSSDPESSSSETPSEPSNSSSDPESSSGETSPEPSDSSSEPESSGSETSPEPSDSSSDPGSSSNETPPEPSDPSVGTEDSNPPTKPDTNGSNSGSGNTSSTTEITTSESTTESGTSTSVQTPEVPKKPGGLTQTGGMSNKKPNTLPQTGEGNGWVGKILSILGTGMVVFVGYIYIRLNRKS